MQKVSLALKFFLLRLVRLVYAKRALPSRSNVGFSKATTIGLLYSYESPEKHEMVQRFIRQLKNVDKKVSVLCYTVPNDRMHASSHLLYAFDEQAFGLWGDVHHDRIKKFITTSFDYLIHLDFSSNALLDWIIVQSQAKCRMGAFNRARKDLFEVMVKVDPSDSLEDMQRLIQQVLHYAARMES